MTEKPNGQKVRTIRAGSGIKKKRVQFRKKSQ